MLKGFYDKNLVASINNDIFRLAQIIAKNSLIDFDSSLDLPSLLYLLSSNDRKLIGHVYDAAKMLPSIHKIINSPRNFQLFSVLRPNAMPGLASNGHGVRIDLPYEEKYSAPWHQEFPNQFRSLDGIVFWTPLMTITPQLGPVHILPESHVHGVLDVELSTSSNKTGAYAMNIRNIDSIVCNSKRDVVAPLCEVGDLIIIDFLTLHRSGQNISNIPRMSLQFRLFNFLDPSGQAISWQGSFASGEAFDQVKKQVQSIRAYNYP